MRIAFVVRNVSGFDGITKATLNTAAALAESGHEVTVVSCIRNHRGTEFRPDPRLALVDLIGGSRRLRLPDRWTARRPSPLGNDLGMSGTAASALLDRRLAHWLRGTDADVVVGTYPGLNRRIAAYARPGTRLVAWEHAYLDKHGTELRKDIVADYPRFDAIVTGTEADARAYREALGACADEIEVAVETIPNLVPAVTTAESEAGFSDAPP